MMTLSKAIAILKKAKIKQAELEVWDLLAAALMKNKAGLILTYRPADKIKSKKFNDYIRKRAAGAPYAYVVGHQPFLGQNFLVTKDTLIPRPATEDLVLAVEKYLSPVRNNFDSARGNNFSGKHSIQAKRDDISNGINIFDIGTGSGCIAISLALRNPKRIKSITATDISAKALSVARRNLISNSRELETNKKVKISFKKTDLLKNISLPKNCIIIANLPYVRPVRNRSHKLISNGEPKSAIFCAYKNGLPVTYLELLKQLQKQKNPPQAVFLEMPRACSTRFQKLWHSTLPRTTLFIIRI